MLLLELISQFNEHIRGRAPVIEGGEVSFFRCTHSYTTHLLEYLTDYKPSINRSENLILNCGLPYIPQNCEMS